jgi:HK97 family phage major capsid protein
MHDSRQSPAVLAVLLASVAIERERDRGGLFRPFRRNFDPAANPNAANPSTDVPGLLASLDKKLGDVLTKSTEAATSAKAAGDAAAAATKRAEEAEKKAADAEKKASDSEKRLADLEAKSTKVTLGASPVEQYARDVLGTPQDQHPLRLATNLFERMPRELMIATAAYVQSLVLSGCTRKLPASKIRFHQERMEQLRAALGEAMFIEQRSREAKIKGPNGPIVIKIDLQEDTASEGGNTVPTPFERVVLRLAENAAMVRPVSTVIPMTAKTHQIPSLDTAPTAYIVPEETDMSASAEAWAAGPFGQKNLTAKKIGTYTEVSGELAQDNAVLLMQLLATVFGEAIALLEDDQALEGDGAGNNYTGLFAAAGLNSVAGGSAAPTYDLLLDTVFAAPKTARRGAMWFMHRNLIKRVAKIKDSQNLPIFSNILYGLAQGAPAFGAGLQGQEAGMLLGYPVRVVDEIATNRGAGTNESTIYFGNPGSFHLVFGDLMGLELATSDDFKFATFQIAVRALKRTGILVAVPSAFTKYTAVLGT